MVSRILFQIGPRVGAYLRLESCGCGAKRETGDGGWCSPSPEAVQMLDSACEAAGMSPPSRMSGGSGWFIELPTAVSLLLDSVGRAAAEALIGRCVASRSSQEANEIVWRIQELALRPYLGGTR